MHTFTFSTVLFNPALGKSRSALGLFTMVGLNRALRGSGCLGGFFPGLSPDCVGLSIGVYLPHLKLNICCSFPSLPVIDAICAVGYVIK